MISKSKRFAPVFCILALAALPGLTGCSVLGIATANDLETVQTAQETQSRRSAAQIQTLEQDMARLDTQMTELENTTARLKELENMSRGDLDSLMTEFRAATGELEAMGLATMAEDLAAARENSRRAVENYLNRLKAQHIALGQEITELEAMSQPTSDSKLPDPSESLEDLGSGGQ